jgi:hypothetical protein
MEMFLLFLKYHYSQRKGRKRKKKKKKRKKIDSYQERNIAGGRQEGINYLGI